MYFQKFIFIYPFLTVSNYPFQIFKPKQYIPQIRGDYSFFNYEISKDNFRYKSKARKKFKNDIPYIVQDHHIIPKQFKNHKLILDIKFDINCSNNLLIMPALGNGKEIFVVSDIIYHKAHPQYNKMVLRNLNDILFVAACSDDKAYHLWLLLKNLESRILLHDQNIFS